MLCKKLVSLFAAALVILGASSASASAQCPIQTWSLTSPPVNQLQIFCGELIQGRPKGYHSKVYSPSTQVVTGTRNATPQGNGIYNAEVNFSNGTTKLSAFFPDACTQKEIIASVIYANAHPLVPQPSVPWGYVGTSAPADHAAGYCLGTNGRPINIRYARLANGDINLAFPQ